MISGIPFICQDSPNAMARDFFLEWHLVPRPLNKQDVFWLEFRDQSLWLKTQASYCPGAVRVDFCSGPLSYRRKFGGGKKQALARALGIHKQPFPRVVDATAGLGRDAFVLAALGCRVHMLERHPVIAPLLADGLRRARLDPEIGAWVSERMSLSFQDSRLGFSGMPFVPDVIYLDPMFPERKKAALAKKDMQMFQTVVGTDPDADDLLPAALQTAAKRLVVKRPSPAPCLNGLTPDSQIKTVRNRFDVYLRK